MKDSTLRINGKVIVPKCRVANDFFSRLLGLMGRKGLPSDEALVFPNCNSIHTFFMRFPIDVVLVSKEGMVVDVLENLKAWRMTLPRRGVKHVIEMTGRQCHDLGVAPGMTVNWD